MRIKELFEKTGMAKVEFCRKAGISRVSFDDILNNKTYPKADSVEKLARAFGVPCGALFDDWQEEPTPDLVCPHCGKPIHVKIE